MTVLLAGRPVTPSGRIEDGWLLIDHEEIVEVGTGRPPRAPDHDAGRGWIVPGFVDLHVHGGGGHAVGPSVEALTGVLDFHGRHGTTSALLSLISGPLARMSATAAAVAELAARDTRLLGCHLEGPFLSRAHRGAHDASMLREPDQHVLQALLTAAEGTVRMVTLAPELSGGLDAVRQVVAAGALAAVGHTAATYAQTVAALAAGARHATHLFNAMPVLHHRKPGPVTALLEHPDVTLELIVDGIHLDDAVARLTIQAAGAERVVLVTDAMSAAGMPDGRYWMEDQPVLVTSGTARLADGVSLAGSVLTMDVVFRRAVQELGCSPHDAVAMTSTNAARTLGADDRLGSLEKGKAADLVVLGEHWDVRGVMREGRWLQRP